MEILSRLDLYEIGRQYVLTRAKKIDPKVVDTQGSDANLFIGSTSYIGAAVSNQVAQAFSELFLDSNEGEALDRWAFDRYRLVRLGASAALSTVQFSRATATAGAGSIPLGTKLITLTGIEYVTLADAVFSSSQLVSEVDVRAAQAGKAFQIGANGIRLFDKQSDIFDQSIVVNNAEGAAGGEDVEDDDTFKNRIANYWISQRRGTLGAIAFGALLVPGVASAVAVDEINSFGQPARVVRLTVADSSGIASRALGNKVMAALNDWRAGGIFVYIDISTPQLVAIQLRLTFLAGIDTTSLTTQIRSALLGYVNSIGVGQTLQLADLYAVLSRYKSSGLIVSIPGTGSLVPATIVAPVGDLVPDVGKTLRTTSDNITVI